MSYTRIAFLLAPAVLLSGQTFPDSMFQTLEWRFIGPFRAGRVVSAVGIPGKPNIYYSGSVGGGVWKSTNGGLTWAPVFDANPVASIGDIALAPSNPDVVYVGTGETDIRSDLAIGDGVYKSTDAGKTWKHIGLRETRQVGRVLVDPADPDIVFVAALGHAYGASDERGLYRSADGGATWKRVLDAGRETGIVDVAYVPGDPKTLYAASWGAHRPPWSTYAPLVTGGAEIYRSADGGLTWSKVRGQGLPDLARRGRAGLAAGRDGRLYVLLEGQGGGLFRSGDGGATFVQASSDPRIASRGWYFGQITVDPVDPDIVYVPNVALYRSRDGGKTFQVLKGAPGGDDYHSLWVDPRDPSRMVSGTDQGATISVDGGQTWTPWYNQPTAQMYHVAVDNQFPYWVYGSQQDSGTVALPSRSDHNTISEYDRRAVGGEESGAIAPDPDDPNIVYVGNTYGTLARFDKRTSQSHNITPWPSPGFGAEISQRKYRFPWTAPLVFSPVDRKTLYYGAQMLLKTVDGGLHWTEISPDLTGADPKTGAAGALTAANAKARGYGVIYSIAPSPRSAGLIWVGSDTGMVHVTPDGGKTWTNVTPPGLSDWSKIAWIEASHFDAAVGYAAVDRHRLDDYQPHLYRTRDSGKTWTKIVAGIGDGAFLNAIREDPVRKGLLFAATEKTVYVSFDDGDHWQPLQRNLPVTSVRDIVVKDNDLVIATHGRGFWILDGINSLREFGGESVARLYKPARAVRITNDTFPGTPLPPEAPQAKNPPTGAMIDYWLASDGECSLEILDGGGSVIRRFSSGEAAATRRTAPVVSDVWISGPQRLTGVAGLNRFVWDLRFAPPGTEGQEGPASGPLVLPGRYTVRLSAAGRTLTQPVEVVLDPRSNATPAELRAQFELGAKVVAEIRRVSALAAEARKSDADRATRLGAALRDLAAVLGVINSADRTPPAQALALFEDAMKRSSVMK